MDDNPNIGIDPRSGRVTVIARGIDDRLYRWRSTDKDYSATPTSEGWSDPELVDAGRLVTGAPATIIYHGVMHIFARGLDNAIYHWSKDETWHWEIPGGTHTGDPDVYYFGGQLQSFGRGADGGLQSVWYDHEASIWNQEDQGVMVSDGRHAG